MDSYNLDQRLRRAMRPIAPTERQRKRYQDLLFRQEVDDMAFIQRRSLAELAVIVTVLAAIIAVAGWWQLGNSRSDKDEDAVTLAAATLTARESAAVGVTATEAQSPGMDAGSATCTVTPFHPDPPVRFQTADAQQFPYWYGDSLEGLWAAHGAWHGSTRLGPDDPNQWFVGRNQVVLWGNASEDLTVTGRPLEGQPGTIDVVTSVVNTMVGRVDNRMTVLDIPTPGCWEIVGTDGDRELRIVVDVRPFDERPDVVQARERHELIATEFPVPANCSVTGWSGPDDRDLPGGFVSSPYWMDGEDVSLFNPVGFLVAEEDSGIGWWSDDRSTVSIAATLIDDSQTTITIESDEPGPGIIEDPFFFPTEGCWELEVTKNQTTERFVVYVRPVEAAEMIRNR